MKENFKKLVKNLEEIGFIGKSEVINNIFAQEPPKDIVLSCFYIRDFAGIDFIPTTGKHFEPLRIKEDVIKLAEETETLLSEFFITNLTHISGDPEKRKDALRGARHLRNLCDVVVSSGAK